MSGPRGRAKGKDLPRRDDDPDPADGDERDGGQETAETDGQNESMSTNVTAESARGVEKLDEYYDGLEALDACFRGGDNYLILSRRNGDLTMHSVLIDELECSCPDKTFNRDEAEPCAHLAKAVLVDSHRGDDVKAVDHLTEAVDRVHDRIDGLENAIDVERRTAEANAVANESGDSPAGGDPEPTTDVERAERWLEANDITLDGLTVEKHDQYGSINIETDGIPDDDFERLDGLRDTHDAFWFSRSNGCYVIKEEDIDEVLG